MDPMDLTPPLIPKLWLTVVQPPSHLAELEQVQLMNMRAQLGPLPVPQPQLQPQLQPQPQPQPQPPALPSISHQAPHLAPSMTPPLPPFMMPRLLLPLFALPPTHSSVMPPLLPLLTTQCYAFRGPLQVPGINMHGVLHAVARLKLACAGPQDSQGGLLCGLNVSCPEHLMPSQGRQYTGFGSMVEGETTLGQLPADPVGVLSWGWSL